MQLLLSSWLSLQLWPQQSSWHAPFCFAQPWWLDVVEPSHTDIVIHSIQEQQTWQPTLHKLSQDGNWEAAAITAIWLGDTCSATVSTATVLDNTMSPSCWSYLPDAGQIEGMVQRDEQQETRQGKHKLNSACTSAKTIVTECTHVHSNSLCKKEQKQSAAPVYAYQTCTSGGPCILFELFGSRHCLSWQHAWLSSCSWFHTHASWCNADNRPAQDTLCLLQHTACEPCAASKAWTHVHWWKVRWNRHISTFALHTTLPEGLYSSVCLRVHLNYEPVSCLPGCIENEWSHQEPPECGTAIMLPAILCGAEQADVRDWLWWGKVALRK